MNHDEAIKDGATERYVLEEMTDEERDAFEMHYFDCAVCAEDVRTAIALREGLAAVHRHDPIPAVVPFQPRRRTLPASLAAAAAAMIAVVSMYGAVVQPLRKSLQQAREPAVLSDVLKKPVNLQPNRAAQQRFVVQLDRDAIVTFPIAEDERTTPYACTIVDHRGNAVYPFKVSSKAAQEEESIKLELRKNSLEPGDYTLRIDTKPVVTDLPFTVR